MRVEHCLNISCPLHRARYNKQEWCCETPECLTWWGKDRIKKYVVGNWFTARTIEEMQEFYLSRLPSIRTAARKHGYAIGIHGSMRRDFDLMAMQWVEGASDKDTLAHAIAVAACGITQDGAYVWEKKPNGRSAVSICICWTDHTNQDFKDMIGAGHVDLSVIETHRKTANEIWCLEERTNMKLIDREPTQEMKAAGQAVIDRLANDGIERYWQDVYAEGFKAMFDAAPDLASPALNRVKAEALREALRLAETTKAVGLNQLCLRIAITDAIRARADAIEKGTP